MHKNKNTWFALSLLSLGLATSAYGDELARSLGVSFSGASRSTLLLERDGKKYLVDVASQTIREVDPSAPAGQVTAPAGASAEAAAGADVFRRNCVACHGVDGKGIRSMGTPDFTSATFQGATTDEQITHVIRNGAGGGRMPAWSGKLSDDQINAVAAYVRAFKPGQSSSSSNAVEAKAETYVAGDDLLFSLPTGRPVDKNGLYVNFTHRFAYDPAFTGPDRGAELFGLDNFALASLGLRYGVTGKLSVSLFRSPSFIGRPIQLMAAYNLLDEHQGAPLNVAVRVSIEGQDNFRKNYTENLEAIFSRSLTSRAQIYFVPTISFNDRRLAQGGLRSTDIPDLPGTNAFSIGIGGAFDVQPSVALLGEVIPTVVHGRELGIHRPAYSFGIQKKIFRHAFTLGLTTSPGTTVSQRAGTRATFLKDPGADTPGGLFFGFDIMRQVH